MAGDPTPVPVAGPASDDLATPLVWADRDARVAGCNPAFARWLGVSARRLAGQPLVALEHEGESLRLAIDAAPASPDSEEARRLRRLALAFPGLSPRFADGWLSRSADGWLLEAHPVDEFPGADPTQTLPSALAAALRGLAHELRNPLAGLKGASQLLARRIEEPESRELIELVGSEVERLNQLLEQLLAPTPARPPAGFNIHASLERVLRLAEADAGWAVRLVRDYDPSLPGLHGDADRVTQALWNLVRNAIEAGAANVTLRTRIEHNVQIGERSWRRVARVEVADDGHGVPDELAEHVFLPLVSGRADGSGLGLPLAQQVAREHRGALSYRSRPGHTVFTLLLPLADDDEEDGDDA